jgi:iron complex outermembrane recepter protein
MSKKLYLSASVLALICSNAALAQSATATRNSTPSASGIEEVVVTAERRTTNLQKTAIAASVFSGEDLVKKGVTSSVDQLQTIMPSVTIQNFGQGNDFNIRGIGKGEQNSSTLVGVVTYRDGVATFPGYFQTEPFFDIGSVEVLRGPQGTFAGQNATGGAVFITETNPNLDSFGGYAQVQYGNYNDVGVQAAVNMPISDTVAIRLATDNEYHDSFYTVKGPYSGDPGRLERTSERFSLLWQPTMALKVLFKTDYNYIDEGGLPADPVLDPEDPFHITSNAPQAYFDRFLRSVLDVSYRFENGITLRSVSGYQNGRTGFKGDSDGTDIGFDTFEDAGDEDIYSEELNLVSPDTGPLTWVGGVYYSYDKLTIPDNSFEAVVPPLTEILTGVNPKETEAVFGQASYALPAGFEIQVGARYTSFRTSITADERVPLVGLNLPDHQSERDSRLTGKVALNWTIDPDNFLYAFVATGHKGGGLNLPLISFSPQPPPPAFKPENVTDYEVGWKSTLFDDHVTTQIGGYYNDYNNFQVSIGNPTDPSNSFELNVPSTTKIYGLETQLQAVFGALSFDLGASLLHSEFGAFYAVDPRNPPPSFPPPPTCNPTSGPATTGVGACVNLTGNRALYAPTFTFNAGVEYAFDLGNGTTLTPRANFGHIADQWATVFENAALGDRLGERNLLSAQLSYQTGDWDVTAYGTNLTDQEYISAINSGLRYEGAPRQYGLRVSKTF